MKYSYSVVLVHSYNVESIDLYVGIVQTCNTIVIVETFKISETVHLCLYNNLPFIFAQQQEKALQKYQTRVTRWPICCLSCSSSDALVQNCVSLSWLFSCKTAAFYAKQARLSPVTEGLYGFIMTPFSSLVCMHTNHLATKQW